MASKIKLDYAYDTYEFALPLGQLRELQDKLNIGPLALLNRMVANDWRVDDAREIIRLGLIGGGKTPLEALDLVRKYVDERPLIEAVEPALRILSHAIIGNTFEQENAPPKKPEAEETTQMT